MTPKQKQQIDDMTQFEMARIWRFADIGEPFLQGKTGIYFAKVFRHKGFFTPEISKRLGWK